MSQVTFVVSLSLLVSLLAGCGGGSNLPETTAVSGVILLNGTPLAEASVTFTPATGRQATGTTNQSGEFVLTTFQSGDGAIPGEHQVTVEKYEPANPSDPYATRKLLVPEIYSQLKTTPLKENVLPNQNSTVKLELSDK